MAENKRFTKGLKPRHYAAIDALLTTPSVKAAAAKAGATYNTLLHWMRHPKFLDAYRERGMAAMQHSIELSRNNTNAAMGVIMENMQQKDDPRLAAQMAQYVIDLNMKWTECVDVLGQLERIKEKLARKRK